jgi:uncharacterized damage-inducible protein DinB
MNWIAPEVTRVDELLIADERPMLEGWLEWHRATLLWKCAGLTGEQLARQSVPPSDLSLLGLVRHMTDVERSWFRTRFRGVDLPRVYPRDDRRNAAWEDATAAGAEGDFERFTEECDLAREAVAGASLDEQFTLQDGRPVSLRWVYNHMIEEYARHNGHADLLRQCIDGVTGA